MKGCGVFVEDATVAVESVFTLEDVTLAEAAVLSEDNMDVDVDVLAVDDENIVTTDEALVSGCGDSDLLEDTVAGTKISL